MFKSEYDQIIREFFDLNDNTTRKYIVALEDAGQEQLLAALSSSLYDKIVSKVTEIDFGTIPMSRGDITKVQGFDNTQECIDIIRKLVLEYKQDPAIVDIVITAINNVKDRKGTFMKAYALNIELPMVVYNTTVLSIERSVSLLISTCIQYIKDPKTDTTRAAFDKVAYNATMDDMLFKQLINFNNMCTNKSLDKVLDILLKNPPKAAAIKAARANRKVAKEDVEMQYGTMTPINDDDDIFAEDEPEQADVNGSDFVDSQDVEDNSPFDPASTIELEDPPTPAYDDDNVDDLLSRVNATDDTEDAVEPENIPTVVPGDSVTSDDQPISEYEGNDAAKDDDLESDEKNLPVAADQEVGVDEGLVGAVGAGLAIGTAVLTIGPGLAKAVGVGIYEVVKLVINFLRMIVYGLYYTSFKFSDFLATQADLIEANANELQYATNTDLSDDERKKVVKKQLKTADKLRKWANRFNMDTKQVNNNTAKEIEKDNKNKYTIDPYGSDDSDLF